LAERGYKVDAAVCFMPSSISDLTAAALKRHVLGRAWSARDEGGRLLVPPKVEGFGDIELRVEDDIGVEVWLGRFTHAHFEFGLYLLRQDPAKEVERTVALVLAFLEDVVNDRLVFYQTPFSGGCFSRSDTRKLAKLLARGETWVWSGELLST
jgi:hypothetical protein